MESRKGNVMVPGGTGREKTAIKVEVIQTFLSEPQRNYRLYVTSGDSGQCGKPGR